MMQNEPMNGFLPFLICTILFVLEKEKSHFEKN